MKKTAIAILIMTLLLSSACSQVFSGNADEVLFIESEILFDSDGDGVKSDLAVLSVLGGSGGYGQHLLDVYTDGGQKIFDSREYTVGVTKIVGIPSDTIIDSIYSVKATDVNDDDCDELVCRQYAWQESHSNHIGDVVSVLKNNDNKLELVNAWFEACK